MKGICKKCGQRISVSASDQPGSRVILCPDCGLPVRLSTQRGPVRMNILLSIVFIMAFISLAALIYYAAERFQATTVQPYVATSVDKIVYLVAMAMAVLGLGLSIITIVLNVIDRHWSLLALVLHGGMTVAWMIIWYNILYP